MGNMDVIDLHWPLAGQNRQMGYQNQAPYSTPKCLNVRNVDVFEERLRGGSRPGLAQVLPPKAFEIDDPPGVQPPIEIAASADTSIHRIDIGFTQDNINEDYGIPKGNNISPIGSALTYDIARGLFHFNLNTIPTGATIVSATFINRGYTAPDATYVGTLMWLRRLTQTGWSETFRTGSTLYGTTSWTRYDYNNLLSWAAEGGDYTATDQVSWTTGPYPSGEFQITGLATLVQDAIDNRGKQFHFILMRQDEGTSLARIRGYQFMNSREWGLSFPSAGPRLSVVYSA